MPDSDPHRLSRFVEAQRVVYDEAMAEIRNGRKESHWMWFIFPQVAGLGMSPTSREYAIASRAEAEAYLAHAVLGPRLQESARAVLDVQDRSAGEIFGGIDASKLRSSATLFAAVSPDGSVFHRIIERYFDGEMDLRTLDLIRAAGR